MPKQLAMRRVLTIPGLDGSGPAHWQTLWERDDPRCVRVAQENWHEPRRESWLQALSGALAREPAPVVLAAHSLGCVLVAHWALRGPADAVAGALLVAPADVDDPARTPECVRDFAPLPQVRLPFPSILVASRDDPYMSVARAHRLAAAWGARFVDVGPRGHLNAESNLGSWPEGRALLAQLVGETRA